VSDNSLGLFNVKLVVFNESGFVSIVKYDYISIVSTLKPVANFFVKPTTVKVGTKVAFVNTSVNNPTTFNWIFEGGTPSSSTVKSPFIIYNTPGVYDVKLTVSNAAGSDSITRIGQITVINPDFKVDNAVTCPGESIQFTDLTNGNPTSWSWSFPGGTPVSSNLQNPIVQYSESGSKTITLIINGTFKVTKTNFVIVNKPIAHFDLLDNKLVSDNQAGNQWYSLTDGIIQEATAQSFTPAKDGSYYLVVTINGCTSDNSDTLDYIFNETKSISFDEQINIYPLPVTQFLNIESSSEIQSIEVSGIAGNVIINQANLKTQKHKIDMSSYSPGIYLLKVYMKGKSDIPVIRKVIKRD